jgi:hypothetical protein
MSHRLVIRAAEQLVAEAEALHPDDRVKQCTYLVGRRGRWTNAYALAENDVAFDRIFRSFTDEEAQVWARYCYDVEVPAMSRGMMWRVMAPMALESAA